jgi:alpha-D-xyloside xylohydrolase
MSQGPDPASHIVDISEDFYRPGEDLFVATDIAGFNSNTGEGMIQWRLHRWAAQSSFGTIDAQLKECGNPRDHPEESPQSKALPFSLDFINARTIRLRMGTKPVLSPPSPSLMIPENPEADGSWTQTSYPDHILFQSAQTRLKYGTKKFSLELQDDKGQFLTASVDTEVLEVSEPTTIPFLYLERRSDGSRSMAASFSLSPGEKICGGGESFTALDKRGQKLVLYCTDARSVQTSRMYKPVPFFFSSRGYGMFLHTSSPVTMDFGHHFDGSSLIFCGEDMLDLFIFTGSPAEILSAYTSLTGRSPLPPLWSFGLWMSRFSYQSQDEVINVAEKLRSNRIPADLIHIDAGWFRNGFNCDFKFAPDRFPDPASMTRLLKEQGIRTSLWQLPYFTAGNPVFDELVQKKLFIPHGRASLSDTEAMPDLSLLPAREWYAEKIRPLMAQGVSVIKADFGEAAPLDGIFSSGSSGFKEHNLYPLRYCDLLFRVTSEFSSEPLIWARSAWAGGQRYPVHWAGDSEVSDNGMACTLRGGLSLGLCGFSFWSHDIGGFFSPPREDLLLRWAFFGMLSSHSRIHGMPPREPWLFSPQTLGMLRRIIELKYRLMPYIYAQAALACAQGLPMLKSLLLCYPRDPGCWLVEDEYLLGNDLLVAPLMEEGVHHRSVYLPPGSWINYQTGECHAGRQWVDISTENLPGILLVRKGSLIPHIGLAQSTDQMDWSTVRFLAFSDTDASGDFFKPGDKKVISLQALYSNGDWVLRGPDGILSIPVLSFQGPDTLSMAAR